MFKFLKNLFSKKTNPSKSVYILKKVDNTGEHNIAVSYSFNRLEEKLFSLLLGHVLETKLKYEKIEEIPNCYGVYTEEGKHTKSFLIEELSLI